MKPIEAGCLAVIVGSRYIEYVGQVVTVIRRPSRQEAESVPTHCLGCDRIGPATCQWVIEGPALPALNMPVSACQNHLRRLDGNEDQFKEEERTEKRPTEAMLGNIQCRCMSL